MSLVNMSVFYREHGIRTIGQMMTLRSNELTGFQLPLNSTLHVTVRGLGEIGIPQEDELIVGGGKRILSQFIFEYTTGTVGGPVKKARQILPEVNAFLKQNRNMAWVQRTRAWIKTPAVPYVINYCSIDNSYRYRERDGVNYHRQTNYFNTVIDQVANELANSDRHQFIFFDPPTRLPALTRLVNAERQLLKFVNNPKNSDVPLDRATRAVLDSDGLYLLMQLWLWVGDNPHLSLFSQLPSGQLDRVLLLSSFAGRYSVVNLGIVNTWIRRIDNPKAPLSTDRAQRLMLRYFMSLLQLGSVGEDSVIVDAESVVDRQVISAALTDDPKLADTLAGDGEFKKRLPTAPHLEVNIDGNRVPKDNALNLTAKAKETHREDTDVEKNDAEDYLFDQMDRDLEQLSATAAQQEVDQLLDSENVYTEYSPKEVDYTTKINEMAQDLAAQGFMTAAEVRRANGLAKRHEQLDSPFKPDEKLNDYVKISKEQLAITDTRLTKKEIVGVVDKSMMNYSLKDFKKRYINDLMGRDIVASLLHFQKVGIAITDISMKRTDSVLGSYNTLSFQMTPIAGKPFTSSIDFPVIDEDGIFTANGVNYKQKIQRRDLPIRKILPEAVALTAIMSKMFVKRSVRARFNWGMWLVNQINLGAMDNNSPIRDLKHGDVYNPENKLPYTYSSIALGLMEFKFGDTPFYFDYSALETNFPPEVLKRINLKKHVPFAFKQEGEGYQVYVINYKDQVELIDLTTNEIRTIGKFTELIGIERSSEPVNMAEIQVLGSDVPAVVILGYYIGLGNLLKTTKVRYRRVPRGKSVDQTPNEFTVIFEDETLVFDRDDQKAALIFNGFNRLKNDVRRISVYSLDKPDAYATLLSALKIPLHHLKQYKYIRDGWVDHITEGALIEMKEPTDMVLLFLSAIDKLMDDSYKDPNAVTESMLWGYQRISSYVYDALFKAVRQYVNAPASRSNGVSINPREVWFSIIQDQTVAPIEESNPIHAIKENEVVVFRGKGGRSADTMTAKHRQFTRDDIGIISEANVDNGQTGTVTYLTADPNITNLRGNVSKIEDVQNAPRAKLQSTAMMLSAGSDGDDSKRVTFSSVMFTSSTFIHDSVPNRVRTGGESTVAFRADSRWAKKARGVGSVVNLTKTLMTVRYDDGTEESISIGRHFGTWSGNVIPHEIKAMMKVGDRFEEDDILAYNSHYFEIDVLNPKHVIFKRGIRGNVLFWETRDTIEDANSISTDFAKRIATSATEKRYVKIPADHAVELLINEGDTVDSETILCTLRPPMSGLGDRYGEAGSAALDVLNTLTPKADHAGVVERIELMYTGELDSMSDTLKDIVSEYDSKLYRLNKKLGKNVKDAQIDPNYSIKGRDVGLDQVVLVYYITTRFEAGQGDKIVLGNQMKTIISNVVHNPFVAEDGTVVDITFSRQGIDNRIVNSMDLIGVTNTYLKITEKDLLDLHDNVDPTK